jgi:AbrB family looped-hinge helix DNA binding protein
MASSTLTSKGQITIPREVRDRLGLREGDRVVFQFDEQGNLLLRQEAHRPLGRLPGLLKHLAQDRPVTIEEMRAAVKKGAAARFKRSVKP